MNGGSRTRPTAGVTSRPAEPQLAHHYLVGKAGFEPAASRFQTENSNQAELLPGFNRCRCAAIDSRVAHTRKCGNPDRTRTCNLEVEGLVA